MHPLTAQELVNARIDGFRQEADARRLVAAATAAPSDAPSHAPVERTTATPIRDRIVHAFGRVHLLHRGSGA